MIPLSTLSCMNQYQQSHRLSEAPVFNAINRSTNTINRSTQQINDQNVVNQPLPEGHVIQFNLNTPEQAQEILSKFVQERKHYATPFAVVSGCGPAGCTAALTLKKNGFNVLIVEKRSIFTRTNVLELKNESIFSLTKLSPDGQLLTKLLENGFSAHVATISQSGMKTSANSRFLHWITPHELPINIPQSVRKSRLTIDALDLAWPYHEPLEAVEPSQWSMGDIQKIGKAEMGSCMVRDLEKTLNQFCLDQDIYILNAELHLLDHENETGYYASNYHFHDGQVFEEAQLGQDQSEIHPNLVCIAEGASSENAKTIGKPVCIPTEEVWHQINYQPSTRLGNFMRGGSRFYLEKEQEKLVDLSNIILHVAKRFALINASVLCRKEDWENKDIKSTIRARTLTVLRDIIPVDLFGTLDVGDQDLQVMTQTQKPIEIQLKRASIFAKRNAVILGDSACSGSPTGGYGASLGMSAYPQLLEALIKDNHGFDQPAIDRRSLNKYQKGCEKIMSVRWGRPSAILNDLSIYSNDTFKRQLAAQLH